MRPIGNDPVPAGSVTLRPWEPADVSFVYDACQDPEIQRWSPLPQPYRPGDAVMLLHLATQGRATNRAALFAITATDTGELLGSIGLKEIDWEHGRAEAGYWVARDARGRGVATAALEGLARWAGEHLELREVWLTIAVGNEASIRVAKAAGFVESEVVVGGCELSSGAVDALIYRKVLRPG
jgi:RimJ/RimL family protein N-acetyltransferase